MSKTRIYLIRTGDKKRLVRATHPSTALMHVVNQTHTAAVASQDDLELAFNEGLKVETIGAEQTKLPE